MSAPEVDRRSQEMWQALEEGERRLAELALTTRALTAIRLRWLKKRDPAKVLTAIQKMREDLHSVDKIFDDIYQRGRRAEQAEALAQPLGAAWAADVERRLAEAATFEGWTELWLDAWSQALAADQLGRAREIAVLPCSTPGEPDLHEQVATVSAGLTPPWTAELSAAVEALSSSALAGTQTRVRMLVLRSRYLRRFANDPAAALDCAQQALRVSHDAGSASAALATAAVVEAYLDLDRLADAAALLGDALDFGEVDCDRLIVAGRLAAAQKDYVQADECYGTAAARFPDQAGHSCLLREVPGNLLWALARLLRVRGDPAALELYDRAVEAGMVGNSEHAERLALRDKAELLESLGRLPEAAAAFRAAADRYAAIGSDRAGDLYEKAYRLDRDNAEHCWLYGEHLRFSALDNDEVVDHERMARAKAVIDEGLEKADPTAEQAWVFSSAALAADALDSSADSELLLERGLLLDPGYLFGYAFLGVLLRRHGYASEAVEATEQGMALDRSVEFLRTQYMWALMDIGRYGEVLSCAAEHLAIWPSSPAVRMVQAAAYIRLGTIDAALAVLDEPGFDDETRHFARGVCYGYVGDTAAERAEFQAVWDERHASERRTAIAWAAYRLGLLDEAIPAMTELHRLAPKNGLRASDLGLALLTRGAPSSDDVARGGVLLLGAIETHCMIDELRHVEGLELGLLRRAVAGTPHEAAVSDVLERAGSRIAQRIDELMRRRRPDHLISVRLAEARRQRSADPDAALHTYLDPAVLAVAPETAAAARDILFERIAAADARLADGDLVEARRIWLGLQAEAEKLPAVDSPCAALRARLGLSELELGGPAAAEVAGWLTNSDASALEEALQRFARTPAAAWAHQDGLRAVAGNPALSVTERDVLLSCARQLPYDRLFRTSRASIPAQDLTPLTRPIGLALGHAHADLIADPRFQSEFPPLRERLTESTGVRIPGISVYFDSTLAPDEVSVTVHERTAGQSSVPPDDGAIEAIMHQFEQVLRANLFRWISTDDVELWVDGWDAVADDFASDAGPWLPPEPADRVRLARVLRALLAEGVAIRDRDAITEAFRASAPGPLARTLRDVRRRLYPAILGGDPPAQALALDGDLEARIAEGLDGSPAGTWELSREQAVGLVADLRAWRDRQAFDGSRVVSVHDERVRPFAWRLLAADRPLLFVVGKDELP